MPAHFDSIVFNCFEENAFYLVGAKNQSFEESQGEQSEQLILEKFFINQDEDGGALSSATMATLLVPGKQRIKKFVFTQNHEFLVIFTEDNSLATYKVSEFFFKALQEVDLEQ